MAVELTVDLEQLGQAESDAEYLQIILNRYNEVWSANPDRLMEIFTEDQLSFLIYGILYNQVYNGGFLQLLFNGYGSTVFDSPLAGSLRAWGAKGVVELLESIGEHCLEVAKDFDNSAMKSLDLLSRSYQKYPEFDAYDKRFYIDDGTAEIKTYISSHLSDFIAV